MNNHPEITDKRSSQLGDSNGRRFTTPLRKVFKRLHVVRKKPTNGIAAPLVDCSNTQVQVNATSNAGEMSLDEKLAPPPAPRPSRLATPVAPPSPISPLPPSVSRSGNLLITRSREIGVSESPSLLQASVMSDETMREYSSPMVPLPCGDLFQLGLTPVPSMRSIVDSECPVFAPALPTVQRVSSDIAGWTSDIDMTDVVNMELDDADKAVTPTPPSRNMSTQWLPNLISVRKAASNNYSTTAVFEGGHLAERRRSTFMSKLVGSTWGFTGLGLASMSGHRRTQSAVLSTSVQKSNWGVMGPLPSIPTGKCSIERAVFGPEAVAAASKVSSTHRNSLVSGLPPANSTLRMTGSKSARALDHLDLENENVAPGAKIEERPKKKRRSIAENFMPAAGPTPSPVRVTRAMAVRQAEIEANTPTRITRSASKRLAELANNPTGMSNAVRSKSVKRL
ncbi:unnamed protein product [Rhizoctonia solani]|uniref:Uncharacterized protein n=1 Tax=Rhizoctonia solani TaxID=456999 RepID=A0A8H3B1M0_9AGAM|nr:unnamed protein product [Rhizoctonia solani]